MCPIENFALDTLSPGSIFSEGEETATDFGMDRNEVGKKVTLQQWLGQLRPGNWNGWLEAAYQQRRYLERLSMVQEHLAECLDIAPMGFVRLSVFARGMVET